MIQSLEKRFMAITWFLTYFTFKGRVTTKYWLHKTSKAHYSMIRGNFLDNLYNFSMKLVPAKSYGFSNFISSSKILGNSGYKFHNFH